MLESSLWNSILHMTWKQWIKCFYGFSHSANVEHSCMYCWQRRAQRRTLTEVKSREPWKYKQVWNDSLFTRSIATKPVRGPFGSLDRMGKWSSIFDIPITNVHFCTLHPLCRIVEKIIHIQISYDWLIKNEVKRIEALAATEHCLSQARMRGKAVVLKKTQGY